MLKKIKKKINKRSKMVVAALGAAIFMAMPFAKTADAALITYGAGNYNISGGTIVTTGAGENGISIAGIDNSHLSKVSITGYSITISGNNASGVLVNPYSTVTLNNVNIVNGGLFSNGIGSNAATYLAPRILNMNGGSITTTNAMAYGVNNNLGGQYTLNDVSVRSAGVALWGQGWMSMGVPVYGTINVNTHGQSISGENGLIVAAQYGNVTINAYDNSQLYGQTSLHHATSIANISLNSGSTWTMPGTSALTILNLNSGAVNFAAPSNPAVAGSYKTLTVGTLGGSGGMINMNGNLNAGYADLLNVTGSVGGNQIIGVRNYGGTPTNLYSTVKVATIAANNNALYGGADVGIYRYQIAPGSALPSAYTIGGAAISHTATDYYLYNSFGLSSPVQISLNTNVASNVLWYGEMNEIKKRMGDLRMGKQYSDDFWVRAYADKFTVKPEGGSNFEQTVRGFEIGKDNPQSFSGGKKFTGFLVGAGKADNTFKTTLGGTGTSDSFYLGAYGSWLRDDGSYFDLIGKYNWFKHGFDAHLLGGGTDNASFRNKGIGLSAEIGKRFERGNGVYVEPAAELSSMWSTKSAYTTANGINIENPEAKSLQLRLGCTVGQKWSDSDGSTRQVYGKASWLREFKGESQTVANNVTFDSSIKGNQVITGLGFVEDTDKHQFYLDLEKSWGNRVNKAWGVNAGMRWKF